MKDSGDVIYRCKLVTPKTDYGNIYCSQDKLMKQKTEPAVNSLQKLTGCTHRVALWIQSTRSHYAAQLGEA